VKTYIIAWRNIWRNRKRTLITIAAVLFAVFLSTFMSSMQEGTYGRMIQNTVSFYSGYIQVHDSNFWESRSINDIYAPTEDFEASLLQTHNVTTTFPRLESFTLLSTGENTKASALIGIDPQKEDQVTGTAQWVVQGEYLERDSDGMLLAINLAKQLDAEVGDTLVLLGMGYHGNTAAALVPITGILDFPSPGMNSFGCYMAIEKAREYFSADGMVTSTVVMIDDYKKINQTKQALEQRLDDRYSVMTWEEMQPEVVQMIQQDRMGGVLMKGILYLVIGFGILGTIIMMMSERKKEMGIMVAVGMQKTRLGKIIFFETLYIGLIGILAGFALSLPVIAYLVGNPIPLPADMAEAYEKFGMEAKMFFSLYYPIFLNQVAIIFVITLAVYLYPLFTVYKMNLIKTLRG
jgi:putative ABC transport system permease protein